MILLVYTNKQASLIYLALINFHILVQQIYLNCKLNDVVTHYNYRINLQPAYIITIYSGPSTLHHDALL